jgi:hypothetical protein
MHREENHNDGHIRTIGPAQLLIDASFVLFKKIVAPTALSFVP